MLRIATGGAIEMLLEEKSKYDISPSVTVRSRGKASFTQPPDFNKANNLVTDLANPISANLGLEVVNIVAYLVEEE